MLKKLNLPKNIVIIYILVSFFLSIIGPATYLRYTYKWWLVLGYLLFVILLFSFGYYLGIHLKEKPLVVDETDALNRTKRLIFISVIFSLSSTLLEFFYLYNSGLLHLSFSAVGQSYFQEVDSGKIFIILRFFFGFFRLVSCCLGLFYYSSLNKKCKFLVIFNIALILIISLFGYGEQKNIGDIFIYFSLSVAVKKLLNGNKRGLNKKTIVLLIFAAFSVLILFAYIQSMRFKAIGVTVDNYEYMSNGQVSYDTNNIIFKLFGKDLGFGIAVILCGYLSQGYYGLSLCMQMENKWTYFVGSSMALSLLAKRFGFAYGYENTYLARLWSIYRRDGYSSWNTIFPWLASDFTFIGAAFLFLFVGYFLAKTWKETVLYNNSISYMFFTLFCILALYIPANNQIFHSYSSFIATCCTIFFWLFFRKKYSIGNKRGDQHEKS